MENETKHTPGPWELEIGDANNRVCFHDDNRVAITHSGMDGDEPWNVTIAEVWPTTGDADIADGRLMAASPDLLDALKGLFEHCAMVHKHWGENSNQQEATAAIAAGQAAIAKAEGRESQSDSVLES